MNLKPKYFLTPIFIAFCLVLISCAGAGAKKEEEETNTPSTPSVDYVPGWAGTYSGAVTYVDYTAGKTYSNKSSTLTISKSGTQSNFIQFSFNYTCSVGVCGVTGKYTLRNENALYGEHLAGGYKYVVDIHKENNIIQGVVNVYKARSDGGYDDWYTFSETSWTLKPASASEIKPVSDEPTAPETDLSIGE